MEANFTADGTNISTYQGVLEYIESIIQEEHSRVVSVDYGDCLHTLLKLFEEQKKEKMRLK